MTERKDPAGRPNLIDVGVSTDPFNDMQVLHASPVLKRHEKSRSLIIGEELGYVSVDVGAISEEQERFNKKTPHAYENCFDSVGVAD